jgi:hypothetical protein
MLSINLTHNYLEEMKQTIYAYFPNYLESYENKYKERADNSEKA